MRVEPYSQPWVESGSKMADRGATWRDVEVKALLEVWSGELIQAQLAGAYRNETVFQTISDMLE